MYRNQALEILKGVGDPDLGEWSQKTSRAYHLRRRLSAKEQERIGPAIDIRGTDEEIRRMNLIFEYLPSGVTI